MTPKKYFEMKIILRCAGDFFKVLMIFKMTAIDELHIFLCVQKLKNLSQEIIHILQSHYPPCVRPRFFNFLVYRFFCPDWTVGGRNTDKIGSCVLFYFFIKKWVGGQKNR